MKRITNCLLLVVATIFLSSLSVVHAQSYYKDHQINENFDTWETGVLKDGWSFDDKNGYFARNAGWSITDDGAFRQAAGGSGNRGSDLIFPTPNMELSDVWYVEFDWGWQKSALSSKNALGLIFSGSDAKNQRAANFYIPAIFGFYTFGDGYLHYWNKDMYGPLDTSENAKEEYDGYMGPVLRPASSDGGFSRVGYNIESPAEMSFSDENVEVLNASTKTNVTYEADSVSVNNPVAPNVHFFSNTTYHIIAKLNFSTQRVESMSITQIENPSNTDTILDMPFLAPTMIGNDTTVVAREDRVVTDITRFSQLNTRGSTAGNGPNVDFVNTIDNLEIYYLKESTGTTDVTVAYVDTEGNPAKEARVAENQQYGELFRITPDDKSAFIVNNYYYAFDAEATSDANIDYSEDGESVLVSAVNNQFKVVFKRFAKATADLVWTGDEGPYWNQLDGNFKSGSIAGLGYQNGKSVEFDDEFAPKDILISEPIDMGDGNITITKGGYNLSGEGRLFGSGKIEINAPVILGVRNNMLGGAYVNITEGVHIKHPLAADTFRVVNNALLKLEAGATFNRTIVGAGEGSVINIEALTNLKDADYNYQVLDASTVNIRLRNVGSKDGSSWTGRMRATYPEGTQLNVMNGVEETDTLVGFSGVSNNLSTVHLHLGDSVRLVRNYNEANNEVVTFGSISGTEKSIIEAGFVGGRSQTYKVGALNSNAVFDGSIRNFKNNNGTFVSGSTLHLNKVGSGTWTLTGHINHEGDINVEAGTLELLGKVDTLVTSITVESEATLKTGDIVEADNVLIKSGAKLRTNYTHFAGDVQVSGSMSGGASMYNFGLVDGELNLYVDDFDGDNNELIISESDITIIRSSIKVAVKNTVEGGVIQLLEAGSGMISYPEGTSGCSFFVNGVDITDNTEETEGAEFVWYPETGELMSLVTKEFDTAVSNPSSNKVIKSVQYFNLLGEVVSVDAEGVIIKRIVFEDNTVQTIKYIQVKQ